MPDHNQDPFGSISITDNNHSIPDKRINQTSGGDQSGPQKRKLPPGKSPLRKWFFALVMIIMVYLTSGFFLVPHLLENTLPTMVGEKLNRQVIIGNSSFNPISLRLTMTNGIIGPRLDQPQDKVDPLCSVINLEGRLSWLSLLTGRPLISRLTINQGFAHLVRRSDKSYNIPILDKIRAWGPEDSSPWTGLLPGIEIGAITLSDSRILFDDQLTGQQHRLEKIQLTLPALKQLQAGNKHAPHFSAVFNDSPINLAGTTTVNQDRFEARFKLKFDQLNLTTYLTYLNKEENLTLEKGLASTSVDLIYTATANEPSQLIIECNGKARNLRLRSQNDNIIKLPLVKFNASLAPFRNRYHLHNIEITDPDISINRRKDGNWQYPNLLSKNLSTEPLTNDYKVKIDRLKVHQGRISFLDQNIAGGFAKDFTRVELAMESFNSEEDKITPFLITAVSRKGKERYKAQGEINLITAQLKGRLSASRIDLADLSPYMTMTEGFYLQKGLISGLETGFTITGKNQPELALNNLTANLNSIVLINDHKKWFTLPGGIIQAKHLATNGHIALNQLTLTSPVIRLIRKKDEKINWPRLTDNGNTDWRFSLDSLLVENGTIILQDNSLADPASQTLNQVSLEAQQLSRQPNQTATISMRGQINEKGSLSLSGPFSLNPMAGEFNGTVSNLDLESLPRPYRSWLPAELKEASLTASGTVSMPDPSFQGQAQLSRLNCQDHLGQPILQIKEIRSPNLRLSTNPPTLSAASLVVNQPKLALSIKDGNINYPPLHFNLQPTTPAKEFWLKTINIVDGTVTFNDQQPTPPLAAEFRLNGIITNAGNQPDTETGFTLQGTGQDKTKISIKGKSRFFAREPWINFNFNLTDQDIQPLAPYFTAVTGHQINGGKISIASNYHRHDQEINSNNRLVLQNLEPGPALTTSNLPLALALLRDNTDKVAIEIPVKGTTHSPTFSYNKTMARGIRNLILKAAVSPVTILKESLDQTSVPEHLLFTAGKAEITDSHQKILTDLAGILKKRQGLHLRILGFADPDYDGNILLIMKKKELEKKKLAYEQLRSNLLAEHYGSEIISPAKDNIDQNPWRDNDYLQITENDLNRLADKRCQNIRDYLQDKLGIRPERLSCRSEKTNNQLGRQNNRCDFLYTVPVNNQD